MAKSGKSSSAGLTLKLDGDVTIGRVAAVREALMGGLERSARLTVDLAGVTDVDTAGLQMIISLQKTAEKQGRLLYITGQPEIFSQAAARLGFNLCYYCTEGDACDN